MKGSYSNLPGKNVTPQYPGTRGGPVRVVSTNHVPVLAALRTIWGTGYSDLMGYPGNQLTTEYWIPVYNNVTMNSQIRFTNPVLNP